LKDVNRASRRLSGSFLHLVLIERKGRGGAVRKKERLMKDLRRGQEKQRKWAINTLKMFNKLTLNFFYNIVQ